jgi:hypothetical protein
MTPFATIVFRQLLQEMVQDTLESALERLDLVLSECIHQYLMASLVRFSLRPVLLKEGG